jgi:hypothetical protein
MEVIMTRKNILPITMIALISFSILAAAKSSAQTTNNERDILRSGGLKAAAKAYGHYSTTFDVDHWQQYDLKMLTDDSDMVIEAAPVFRSAVLSQDGSSIDSSFALQPIVVVKGTKSMVARKYLIVPGGLVKFEDGTSAEVKNSFEKALETGGTYLFFLKENSDGFHLVGFGQGLIALDMTRQTVSPQAKGEDSITAQLRGKSPTDVLEAVRGYATN